MPRRQTPSRKDARTKASSTQKKRNPATATAKQAEPKTYKVLVAYAWENGLKQYVFQVTEDGVLGLFAPDDKGELQPLALPISVRTFSVGESDETVISLAMY